MQGKKRQLGRRKLWFFVSAVQPSIQPVQPVQTISAVSMYRSDSQTSAMKSIVGSYEVAKIK